MSDFDDNLEWLRGHLSNGHFIYKAYRPFDSQPRYNDNTNFIAANVTEEIRLYLFLSKDALDQHVDGQFTLAGWPADYETGSGSPASGKVDYSAITRGIVGR